jgi:ribosomal protection tetracycline resistance protein
MLEEEDPQLHIVWNEALGEIQAQVMGDVQMEILKSQVQERFGVEIEFGEGNIVYKETIAKIVEGVGHFEPLRHYAEVHLLMEPGEPGTGLVFDTSCSEDMLDKNWQRLILTHLEEKRFRGILTGSEITDMKITLIAGRAHQKHTEGGDFRQATYRAVRQGLCEAGCVLLEPYYAFRLEVPSENLGRAMADLDRMQGEFSSPEQDGSMALLTGTAPVSTMRNYQRDVISYTKGRGRLTLSLSGYEPCHNAEEVIAASGYDFDSDLQDPAGSVFCSHGAGFVVPWDEVPEHMHLPYVYHGDESEEALAASARTQNAFSAEDAQALAGNRRRTSFEKAVSGMSSVELDAQLADVYAREFGMGKNDIAEDQRRKWSGKKKNEYEGLSGKPRTVKHDKHGNPIYPKKSQGEEYLIVDGYNIIFAWEDLKELSRINIDSARDALKDVLSDYQGYKGCHLLLVFDAYKVKGNAGKRETFHNIEVVYTKQDETADAFIEKTVFGIRDRYKVTVATSDGLEQQTVMSLGALRMSARELKRAGMEAFISR